MNNKLIRIIQNPYIIFAYLASKGCFKWMDDKTYLCYLYRANFAKKLNLNNPITYSEKLQWLKLYDRRKEYVTIVDKNAAKEWVSKRIGEKYIIPTLGVWDSFEKIDFDQLPNQFVLKCTHDSGGVIICTDKKCFDKTHAKTKIDACMKRNFYYIGREWPYREIKPQIIAEKYMIDKTAKELKDYKFFCFNGICRALFVASDRQSKIEDTKFDFFDREFNHLPLTNGHPNSKVTIRKPKSFEKMVELSEKLSTGIPEVRVDLYNVDGNIYFGEMTLFHWSGLVPFSPEEWDITFGNWIQLPEKQKSVK